MGSAILAERQFPYMEQGGHVCKSLSHGVAYVEKKARGRLTAPACLSTCFKMVSAFFRGEPLGYPWEGGCISCQDGSELVF